MTYQSRTTNREASLELSLAATKSLVSSYVLRAKQAEELAGRLLMEKLSEQQMSMVVSLITEQIKLKAYERSVQQQAVLQASVVALNAALQAPAADEQRRILQDMLRDLTSCVEHMKPAAPQ